MNIKELSNPIMRLFLGKANTTQTEDKLTDKAVSDFAGMVAGAVALSPDALVADAAKIEGKAVEARPVRVDENVLKETSHENRPIDKKEKKPAREAKETVAKENTAHKVSKRKEKQAPEAAAVEVQQQVEASAPLSQGGADVAAEAPAVAGQVVELQVGAVAQTREMPLSSLNGDVPMFLGVIDGSEVVLTAPDVNMSELAQLPQVSVFDKLLGEVVTMSGEEFAAQVQAAATAGELFVATGELANDMGMVLPAEILPEAESRLNLGKLSSETVLPENMVIVDEEVAVQAQVLDSKLKGEHKLSVEVNLDEENFSHIDETSDLLADKIAVDEIINAAVKEQDAVANEGKNSVLNPSIKNQTAQTSVQAQAANAAMAMTSAQVEANTAVESAKSAVVENIGQHNSAHQALNNAVASQAIRPEAQAKADETSFRDVYKGMSREAVEQVKVNITKSAVKGVDKIEIQLKPEDLGHVQVKMQISKDGKLHAEIIASRQETLEILQKEIETLQKAFQDAGFDTDGSSFNFSFRGEEQHDQNAELRQFIGKVMEQEANEEAVSNDNYIYDPAQGLNIKV